MKPPIFVKRDELLKALEDHRTELQAAIRTALTQRPVPPSKQAEKRLQYTINEIESFAEQVTERFVGLGTEAIEATEQHRLFKYLRGDIQRDAIMPNVTNTFCLIGTAAAIESLLVGWVYTLEGKMSLVQALGWGATFSCTNVAVGVAIGFGAIRYGCIKYHDYLPVRKIRWIARLAGVGLCGLLGFMILSAARARSLGRSDNLFDWQELPLAATLSDAYTNLFLTIAIVSGLFACFKGATAISDFIVGFSESQKKVREMDDIGIDVAERFEEVIHTRREDAIERFDTDTADPDAIADYDDLLTDIHERMLEYNQEVAQIQRDLADLGTSEVDITHRATSIDSDLSAWLIDVDAQMQTLAPHPQPTSTLDLMGKLEAAVEMALATVKEAHMGYANADRKKPKGI